MSKKSQADRFAAMVQAGQNVQRPSNIESTGNPERRKAVNTDGSKIERITVGTKARKEIAYHWTAQGKLKRRAVADVVQDALIAEFGLPDGFSKEDV